MLQWQSGNIWKRTTKDYHILEPVLESGGSISRFHQMIAERSVSMWSSVRFLVLGPGQVAACDATRRSHDSSSICASLQVINSTTMQRLAVADNPDKICLTNVLLWFLFL